MQRKASAFGGLLTSRRQLPQIEGMKLALALWVLAVVLLSAHPSHADTAPPGIHEWHPWEWTWTWPALDARREMVC